MSTVNQSKRCERDNTREEYSTISHLEKGVKLASLGIAGFIAGGLATLATLAIGVIAASIFSGPLAAVTFTLLTSGMTVGAVCVGLCVFDKASKLLFKKQGLQEIGTGLAIVSGLVGTAFGLAYGTDAYRRTETMNPFADRGANKPIRLAVDMPERLETKEIALNRITLVSFTDQRSR